MAGVESRRALTSSRRAVVAPCAGGALERGGGSFCGVFEQHLCLAISAMLDMTSRQRLQMILSSATDTSISTPPDVIARRPGVAGGSADVTSLTFAVDVFIGDALFLTPPPPPPLLVAPPAGGGGGGFAWRRSERFLRLA